ncbi:MFS transporter [Longispora sp. K20-0274]|uniref:MFS transporter n=1 Tax=Longispora sp. K20-0274 TaxID=3088255 RepID=UPI003999EB4A
MNRLVDVPGYGRLWTASTVSIFGSYVTTLALQFFLFDALGGDVEDLGLMNAARWLPYLLFGLVVGVLVDRYRRRPVLVATDLGRAVLLCLLPVLYFLDRLTIPALVGFMFLFGALSLVFDAADQSLLPRVVPRPLLTAANARLQQSDAMAQSTGPLLAGALLRLVGAPVAILVDAASYLFSALMVASLRVEEPKPAPAERRHLLTELREGVSWVYRHRTLSAMALTTHVWFVFSSMLGTVLSAYMIEGLDFSPLKAGFVLAAGGLGGVLGGAVSGWAGRRFEVGPILAVTKALEPVAWLLVPLAMPDRSPVWMFAGAMFGFWFVLGVGGPFEMSYRASVTPDALQGRMAATMRSFNRASIVLGAPLGGFLAGRFGYRTALWVGIAGFAVVAVAVALSPLRGARHSDALDAEPAPAAD